MISANLQDYPSAPEPVVEQVDTVAEQNRALVVKWLGKIEKAKKKWEPDFKRMRDNMEFASGIQWPGQTTIETDNYLNNITLRAVSQKVATLYAKNPKATAIRRKRLVYQVWDGEMESLLDSIGTAQEAVMSGQPVPVEISALFNDFQAGKTHEKLIDKICKTLEITYQYQVDTQQPDFKEQLKQVVRRVVICGVGYGRPIYCQPNNAYPKPVSSGPDNKVADMAGRLSEITRQIQEDGADGSSNDDRIASIRSLAASMGASTQDENLVAELNERIEFDFLPATSVIPDTNCRALKGFVAAQWIAIEFVMDREDANAIFGVPIKKGDVSQNTSLDGGEELNCDKVFVYEVLNKMDRSHFYICSGYKDFLVEPEPVSPSVDGFWPVVALTFNDIEVEHNTKTSIFPPSDVQLMKSIQKEWNRTRDALRHHRIANQPRYLVRKGLLTDKDKEKILSAEPNEILELEGIPPEAQPAQLIQFMQNVPIDEHLYDTAPLEQDMMMGAGLQQANLGAAQPNVTATVGSIAEQSRLNVSASNVDDLDGFLSQLARMSGEMIMQSFASETVLRIAGPGAAWPVTPDMKADLLNEILLQIEAASSGRPNKALDLQNWSQLAPILQASGVNPAFIAEESVKRLDDNLDVSKLYPLTPDPSLMSPSGPSPAAQPTLAGTSVASQPSAPSLAGNPKATS